MAFDRKCRAEAKKHACVTVLQTSQRHVLGSIPGEVLHNGPVCRTYYRKTLLPISMHFIRVMALFLTSVTYCGYFWGTDVCVHDIVSVFFEMTEYWCSESSTYALCRRTTPLQNPHSWWGSRVRCCSYPVRNCATSRLSASLTYQPWWKFSRLTSVCLVRCWYCSLYNGIRPQWSCTVTFGWSLISLVIMSTGTSHHSKSR